ncbi:MAG: 3-oxoacyl-ACP synthase, partial [Desulfobacteraceae bacterium]|nr:3-oxoacyl-ACP synthase [Desulfobacteraceae bacterium]
KKRGAKIIAEIRGFSCNNNGGDLILPNTDGIKATIRLGLESAGIGPDDVDFISAHATATRMGDVIEARAIHAIYGDKPRVTGLKSYMGHTMGACGVIETLLTLYMMEKGFIAPTLNLDEIDERCSMLRHTTKLVKSDIRIAAIQNFAFGGVNTCLFIEKFDA